MLLSHILLSWGSAVEQKNLIVDVLVTEIGEAFK